MTKPMIVIATRQGYYGEKLRRPGERFPIMDTEHFAGVWMIDPNKPSEKEKVRELEAQYVTQYGPKKRDISDDQLLAEIAQSSGTATALRAENLKLKETIRVLEQKLAAADAAAGQGGAATRAGAEDDAPATGPAEDAAGGAYGHADGEGSEDGDVPGPEETFPARVTRRRG